MLAKKVERPGTTKAQIGSSLLNEDFRAALRDSYNVKLERGLRSIKEGDFRRLFKGSEYVQEKPLSNWIPPEQITAFENEKQDGFSLRTTSQKYKLSHKSLEKGPKVSGIDEILANREKLRPKTLENGGKEKTKEKVHRTALEKMEEASQKAWADRCFDTVYNKLPTRRKDDAIETLLKWDKEPLSVANVILRNEPKKPESLHNFERDLSSEGGEASSDISEKILRKKPDIPEMGPRSPVKPQAETKKIPKQPVNFDLSEFFIKDLTELKSLAFNEELYAFHPTNGITGSWSVDVKVCETDHKLVNVQFEGLIVDGGNNYAMFASGITSSDFTPITEFRVEQVSTSEESRSKSAFFHQKGNQWLFDFREGANNAETRKFSSLKYPQMVRVISESAQILLMRKIVMYYHPLNIEETEGDLTETPCQLCLCSDFDKICSCGSHSTSFRLKKVFKLKMRSFCIGGDICRTNYRFFAPVKIKFNGVQLEVVRVRRRMETPGNLIQITNYYLTTAGQLMAITFNDPYPFDTPFWLQVDPKAVLNPHRVVPPERIVPLRERYMCDPQLKQFYEDEVERLMLVNRKYLNENRNIHMIMSSLLRDILNDKPHRVTSFIQDFLLEGWGPST